MKSRFSAHSQLLRFSFHIQSYAVKLQWNCIHPSGNPEQMKSGTNPESPVGLYTAKQFHDSRFTQQRATSPLLPAVRCRAARLLLELTDGSAGAVTVAP